MKSTDRQAGDKRSLDVLLCVRDMTRAGHQYRPEDSHLHPHATPCPECTSHVGRPPDGTIPSTAKSRFGDTYSRSSARVSVGKHVSRQDGVCAHVLIPSVCARDGALQFFKQMYLCNSLFFHSLEFEDVHGLGVARGGEEHAIHAEGQGADAHTPGGQVGGAALCRHPETPRATSNPLRDFQRKP